MTVENFSVSVEKVKLRYRERYVTEGVNEKATAIPRGCYRGFIPRQSTVPDASFWLGVDPLGLGIDVDSFAIYAEYNDGAPNYDAYALSIREVSDVQIDLSGTSLIPIPAGVTYLYPYITAQYQIGSTTVVTYDVSDEDPYNVASSNYDMNVIKIGRIPVTPGSSIISFDITNPLVIADVFSGRRLPAPTQDQTGAGLVWGDSRWGYLDSISAWRIPSNDQKEGMDAANSPDTSNPFATMDDVANKYVAEPASELINIDPLGSNPVKVTLTGDWYVGKGGDSSDASKYFKLASDYDGLLHPNKHEWEPAYFEEDQGGLRVFRLWLTGGATAMRPSTDADSEGFYNNPVLEISFFTEDQAAQDFLVTGYKKTTFSTTDQAPVQASPVNVQPHSIEVISQHKEAPPLWPLAEDIDEDLNAQAVLNSLHRRVRGTASENMRDEDLTQHLHVLSRNDAVSYAYLNSHYIADSLLNPYAIDKIIPWRLGDSTTLVMLMRSSLTPITLDRVGWYDPVTRTLTEYDYIASLPAPTSAWVYDDIAVDGEDVYIRVTDAGNLSDSRVYKFGFGTTLDSSWPAAGAQVGPSFSAAPWYDKRNRLICIDDSYLAANASGQNLFGGTPATAGLRKIRKADGAIMSFGCGDCTTGSGPALLNPTYAMGPMVSDGQNVYFSTYENTGAQLNAKYIYQLNISDFQTVNTPNWGMYYYAALYTHARGLYYDGYNVWAVGQGDNAGEIGVAMQRSVALGATLQVKNFLPTAYPNSYIGGACFDGKNIWAPIWDEVDETYVIAKLGVQRANQNWPVSPAGGQPLETIVRDFHAGIVPDIAWSGVNDIYADPAFDGENIWFAPEQNTATGAGRGWLFRVPNIMGY